MTFYFLIKEAYKLLLFQRYSRPLFSSQVYVIFFWCLTFAYENISALKSSITIWWQILIISKLKTMKLFLLIICNLISHIWWCFKTQELFCNSPNHKDKFHSVDCLPNEMFHLGTGKNSGVLNILYNSDTI